MPRPPAGLLLIGHGVDVQPHGATCDAAIVLTLPYQPDDLRPHDASRFGIWAYSAGTWHFLGGIAHADLRNVNLGIHEGGVFGLMVAPLGQPPLADYLAPATGTGDTGPRGTYLPLALGITMLASLGGAIVLLGSRRRY